jgi:hypothetical protein
MKDSSGQFVEATLEIGSYNIFEMDSTVEFCKIGSFNKLEHKCKINYFRCSLHIGHVENGATIGNGCHLGALSKVPGSKTC